MPAQRIPPIYVKTDHHVAGQDVHSWQWRFFAYDGKYLASIERKKAIRKTKSYFEIQTASSAVRSTTEAKVYTQEVGTYFYLKLVEDSSSELSLGKQCDE